jgi:hypothetical protein
MDDTGGSLSDIFGLMTTLNGIIAILAGLFAEAIVDFTKNQEAPFLSAVICLVLAFSLISNQWVSQKEAIYYPILSLSCFHSFPHQEMWRMRICRVGS